MWIVRLLFFPGGRPDRIGAAGYNECGQRMVGGLMKITFLGATGTVTGSKYLVEAAGLRLLIDCGLFQGRKALRERNWRPLPVDSAELDAVVLTHAHLDHSGYLPRLIKAGFKGAVYCTAGTLDLCGILLPDSGYLQEEDARYANRKGYSRHHPALPLYTQQEALESLEAFRSLPFARPIELGPDLTITFSPVGHILGAASVCVSHDGSRLVFSGDVGRPADPIMHAPRPLEDVDYLVVESTYGDRLHGSVDPTEALADVVCRTIEREGVVLIPSFAVGRAQSLLRLLSVLQAQNRIPADVPVFLNSPMAVNATRIFCAHPTEHRLTPTECASMCEVAQYVNSVEESKALNRRKGPMIIVSASGMVTGGRILHHLRAFGPDPKNTLLFVGYQAAGTRGDKLVNGARQIRVHGQDVNIRAEVVGIPGLSAHADYSELGTWLGASKRRPSRVFITHGATGASAGLKAHLDKELGWHCEIPGDGSTVELRG